MLYAITAESGGERTLKIGQHLSKLWAKIKVGFFSEHKCISASLKSRFWNSQLVTLCL